MQTRHLAGKIVAVAICVGVVFGLVFSTRTVHLTTNEFSLSSAEVRELARKATKGGDASAAVRLADYYDLSAGDLPKAAEWYERAVKLGDVNAERNLVSVRQSIADQEARKRVDANGAKER